MRLILKRDKRAIEMGFNWIFAILAGTFILFLAVYAASKFVYTQERVIYTETAAKIISLFDPLETGLAAGIKNEPINFKKKSKFYFSCDVNANPPFGKESVSFAEQTFGDKYGERSDPVAIKNKYVFVENEIEGNRIVYFSKPFSMPFKVADIIVFSSKDYCFYDAPEEVKEDIDRLGIENIYVVNMTQKCNGVKVCFSARTGCDIIVNLNEKYVLRDAYRLYYIDDLMYGAIFSSPDIYECNVKRLMNKFYELGKIYQDKIKIIQVKECDSRIEPKLIALMESAKKISYSRDLVTLKTFSDEISIINEEAKSGCKLFN